MIDDHSLVPGQGIKPIIFTEHGYCSSNMTRNFLCPVCSFNYVHIIAFGENRMTLWCENWHCFQYDFTPYKGHLEISAKFIGDMSCEDAVKKSKMG